MALTNIYNGTFGTLGLAEGGNPTQNGVFNAISQAYGGFTTLGRVTDVEVCVRTELEEFYEIGARDVRAIAAGNVHVHGIIGKAYVSGAMLLLLLGKGATENGTTTVSPKFNMTLSLTNPNIPNTNVKVSVLGVKFETWGVHVPQEEFVMENVRFKADRIAVLDNDEGTNVTVTFPT